MTSATLIRGASLALTALTLACGDSISPTRLSEEQAGDMLEAMTAVSSFGSDAGPGMASLSAAPASALANIIVNYSQTVSCPNGGSASVTGTADADEEAGTASHEISQVFSGCKATSSRGRVWTFNGNVTTNVDAINNPTTGVYSLTATQAGVISFASDLGAGSCEVDLTVTMNGDANSFEVSLSGSACGHEIEQSISVSE